MATTIKIKQGEGKTIKFSVTDNNGTVDISTATLTFTVKQKKGLTTSVISKIDIDFDKSEASSGIAYVDLSEEDTDLLPRIYIGELKVWWSTTLVEKSADIYVNVQQAVY